ncbi:MAG: hypothetical protein Kow0080_27950 [Candidatus Promineifilaceae bacterium]
MLDLSELDRARERWQVGHQLFFCMVQSLVVVCSRMADNLETGNWQAARADLEQATYLLWGVSVTFKFTGSFSQAAYEGYVRPNMFEAAEGFSGMWAQDHDFLVKKVLRRLKPYFTNSPEEMALLAQNFRQAFAIMYDSHKFVCDAFEGGQPSLLMGQSAQKTAAEMIDTFKRNRLLTLGVPMPGSE